MLQGEEEDEGQLCKNLLLYYFFVYYYILKYIS